ncbi:MAG: 3'-5' exonuclease [Bacilli bacterium]
MNKFVEGTNYYLYNYHEETSDWLTALNAFEGKNSILIKTIHKSKGLEYEAVFFVGFDDKAFWSFSNQQNEDVCTFL